MSDIRERINVIAAIAAFGAAISFVGIIMAWREFPNSVGFLDLVIFGMFTFVGILSVKSKDSLRSAIWNSILGLFGIAVATVDYLRIADDVGAEAFMDVGLGIWLTFAGMVLFTVFSISDWIAKKKTM